MNRNDFQKISRLRVREAKALIDKRYYPGAYYLLGYAVECALKACIAKQTNKYDFPDKKFVNKIYTHNLEELIKLSGLELNFNNEIKQNSIFDTNWSIVKTWTEDSRYLSNIKEATAKQFYSAVTSKKNGIIPWLKKYW